MAAAETLVHLREPVEAELDDGELLAVALRVDDRHRQAVGEAPGAREPGERVLVGEGADLLLRALAGGALAGERLLEARDLRAQRVDLLLELDLARGSAALGPARAALSAGVSDDLGRPALGRAAAPGLGRRLGLAGAGAASSRRARATRDRQRLFQSVMSRRGRR